jgi:3-phenylpropionate/trans-cinnamate dioxygenase ferredoxin reductase subunit/phthalate 3,4-dioxygenase ferredoxin reductase subunit
VYGVEGQPIQGAVIVNWPRALIDSRRSVAGQAPTEELVGRLRSLLEASKAAV